MNFDVLGSPNYRYTTAQAYRQFAVAVPEPTTWLTMIFGFALVGGALRRLTKVSVSYAA